MFKRAVKGVNGGRSPEGPEGPELDIVFGTTLMCIFLFAKISQKKL